MTSKQKKPLISPKILPWLDVIAIGAWGILMLKYRFTGKLNLLIHPDYFLLVFIASIALIFIAVFKAQQLLKRRRRDEIPVEQHITVFPPGWSSSLLLISALLGFIISPQVFASQNAMNRSVTELLGPTRSQPQATKFTRRPEERTLVEWVRTLNVYPEPDTHTGQKAKVRGFVMHPPDMGKEYLLLSQFVITCCAADAYPIGLPVKLKDSRDQYSPDTWLEVEGKIITADFAGKRHVTIDPTSIKKIEQPKNPYSS